MRKQAITLGIAIALSAISSKAYALGLGNLQIKSGLGQPLVAEIPLISATPIELDQLSVRLASPDAFERVGLERPTGLNANLQFSLGQNSRGQPVIRVTTEQRFNEPVLNFLIEADWGKGAVVREFSALVDPPYIANAVVKPIEAPVVQSTPVISTPVSTEPEQPMETVKLSPVENPLTKVQEPAPTPTEQPTPVVTAQPEVQSNPTPVEPTPAQETQTTDATQVIPPPPPAPVIAETPAAPVTAEQTGTLDPIQAGQTLFPIAERLRTEDVTNNQMMMALLQANPEAFIDGNVNRLKKGAVLRIPSKAEVTQLSEEQAAQLIRAQHSDFRRAPVAVPQPLQSEVAQQPETTESTPAPVTRPAEPAPVAQTAKPRTEKPVAAKPKTSSGRLEIAPPASKTSAARSAQSGAATNAGGTELRSELTQTKETLANREAELAELKSRVADLEKMDSNNQGVIELQNSKVQALEAELKQLREQQAAKAEAAPAISAASTAAASTSTPAAPTTPAFSMDTVTSAWWFYPSIAGLVALLLGGFWLSRRNKKEELIVPPPSASRSPDLSDFMKGMPAPAAASAAVAIQPEVETFESEPQVAEIQTTAVDEVDVLRTQVKDRPTDLDAHLNLLRYFYERGDKRGYEDAARSMRVHVSTTLDARWREASVMGLSILPGHPLFSTSSWNAPKFNEGTDANRADFQMPTSIQQTMTPPAPAAETVIEPVQQEELPSFLAGVELEKSNAENEISLDSYSDIGLEPPHDQQRVESQVMEEDANAATKIELAQAYLEIGDLDGARSMLQEVLAEGGPNARAEAERILRVIG